MESQNSHLDSVYSLYQDMIKRGFTLIYEGEVNHQITKTFTSMADENMGKVSEDDSVRKKVYHVMVECLQNICKHADDGDQSDTAFSGNGIFIVGRDDAEYHIISGNAVDPAQKEKITQSLDFVNSLDKDKLKELYFKKLKEGSISEKGGAGLGFIDMVKKTGHKLEYHFDQLPDGNFFFILKSTISRNK
jgi:hypothetical protein